MIQIKFIETTESKFSLSLFAPASKKGKHIHYKTETIITPIEPFSPYLFLFSPHIFLS